MNANALYRDVLVLWGAAENVRIPHIESCAQASQIQYYAPPAAEIPAWARVMGERIFLVDFDYGEYEGPVGCLNGADSGWRPRPDESTIRRYYLKKRPKWSEAKLDRAVSGRMAAVARGPKFTHDVDTDEQVRRYVSF